MRYSFSKILMTLCIALCCTSCAEDITAGEDSIKNITVTVTASDLLGGTRAAYSDYSLTFESGDQIGVYVLGKNLLEANVCFTYNGTSWVPEKNIEYCEEYTYYAYYPYVSSAYAPDFTQTGIDEIFADYITDAGDKFHRADQSTKAAFNASDLMIGEGTCDGSGTVAFTLDHKKGLAVFDGAYANGIFTGDNIPYSQSASLGYYLMKSKVSTTFTDEADGSYYLYASAGKYTTHTIPKQYLTLVALEDGTFSFSKAGLSYSLDDGETWTALAAGANTPTVTAGNKIMWKNNTTLTPTYSDGIGTFSSTGTFDAEGNIMSLYYGDNAIGMKSLTRSYSLQNLFKNSKIVNAQRLLLPATNISTRSYWGMFENCTSLILPPAIIPIVEMAQEGCRFMFYGCTSLTTPPILPATKMISDCYNGMFHDCTSLTTAPELPATSVGMRAYQGMFSNCTSLTTAPELPATTLYQGCYQGMFESCTSLTSAPELPATTLAENCYQGMFYGCTSMTTAPELPATTLVTSCYAYMFMNCTSLNTVTAAFTTEPSSTYTENWLRNVAATGTFYKNSAASWNVTGANGVPSGWTVITYTP